MVVFSPTKFEDLSYLILRFKQHKKKLIISFGHLFHMES